MASSATFTADERSKAKRYAKRATYDKQAISAILKATPLVNVSFNAPFTDDAFSHFPTILPMLGALGTYNSTNDDGTDPSIYLHGSSASRLTRLTTTSNDASSTGLRVCISATILDGYVLALTPFNHSCNYRSCVIFGHASRVTDPDELLYAMELITDTMVPGRWTDTRRPTKAEVTATGILKVSIETASAKIRNGPPHDDKKDLRDEELVGRVWTGVVATRTVLSEPIACPDNKVANVPGYLTQWVKGANESNQEQAAKSTEE